MSSSEKSSMALDGRQDVTILDCARTGACITSPRSLEACRRMGIKPSDLISKTVVEFLNQKVNQKFSLIEKEAAVLRHERFEQQRQIKVETVRVEREAIIHGLGPAPPSTALLSGSIGSPVLKRQNVPGFPPRRIMSAKRWKKNGNSLVSSTGALPGSTLLQLEERRFARMKLRQQQDLRNAIEMEAKLARIQEENARRAVEELKRQEDDQRVARARRTQLAAAKHEKMLAKKRVEDKEALEQKARRRAEAERERILAEEAKEKARIHVLEIAQRDKERQENADAWRAHTEKLMRQQEEVVEANRQVMLEKERKIVLKMEDANKRRQHEARERREKANARIQSVSYQNEMAIANKKQEMADKQKAAAERAREMERKSQNELKDRAAKSKQEEIVRQKRLDAANGIRQNHVRQLMLKREQVEAQMIISQQEREKERLLAQVEHQLQVTQKEENVARIQRMEEYAREQLVKRISLADARSKAVKERKEALLQARHQAATEAMIRRHRLAEAVEKLRRSTSKWDKVEEYLDYEAHIPQTVTPISGPTSNNWEC
ncbi:uncharacterized protein PHALS_05202 [Plasmopara halstedii]|uniref:Uncharacterized protein n=1 Tax=Plasmopara halstedii TaxID=4781 RepID=A0A0P1AZK2_PLAHL|nr:uncharacterized protein PHALS_05202 [Plasmopara halstedii]CEG47874.1 hypothetical protein PHALS_05202 [Plasmopara halstedii]|eukprot:XP_024584243.1 hypothetical protein PHALS_05202 [Plasmopara halstedii]